MNSQFNECLSYYDYKLKVSRRNIFLLTIIAGFINLVLLVPDLSLIGDGAARTMIAIIRIMYSIVLFIVSYIVRSIKSFKLFTLIISLCEATAGAIFLLCFQPIPPTEFF